MTDEVRNRLNAEYKKCKKRLKHPSDLFNRLISDDDFSDTAVVGGIAIGDVLAGHVHEWEVPSDVKHAFELQYPGLHEGFVSAVQRFSDEPSGLRGLVNGVRGKLFEIDYVKYLNDGHLPSGMTAHLAESATNAAWDISITDAHGHVDRLLQLKASTGIEAAKQALALHPNIDVVVPHDVFQHFSDHFDSYGHLMDGHETLTHLDSAMSTGVHHAELAAGAFHVPCLSFAWITVSTYMQYRTGKLSVQEAFRRMTQRVVTSSLAVAAGWAAQAVLHKSIIGIPVALWVRHKLSKYFKVSEQRKVLDQHITIISDARISFRAKTSRTTLDLGTGSTLALPGSLAF